MKTHRTAGKRGGRKSKTAVAIHAGKPSTLLCGSFAPPLPAPRVPAKWRWHHRVLLSLQSRLSRVRGDLLGAAAEPLEPHSLNEADSASDEFDHNLALTQLSAMQDALHEVIAALQRIRNGRYGVCEETGEAIPVARLKAIPWTRFTRAVEERLEKKGDMPRARLNPAATVRGPGRIRLAPEGEEEEAAKALSGPAPEDARLHEFSPRRNARRPARAGQRKG